MGRIQDPVTRLGLSTLRQELRAHKIPDDIIAEALSEIDADDGRQAAVAAVRGGSPAATCRCR